MEYNIDIWTKALNAVVKMWRKALDSAEDLLLDCDDIRILIERRVQLTNLLDELENTTDHLSELTTIEVPHGSIHS